MSVQVVTVKTIMNMLARNHKGIVFEKSDIGEWCGECIEQIGEFTSLKKVTGKKFTIKNNTIQLPCGVYRVLRVHGANTCDYQMNAPLITFNNAVSGFVTLDYLEIPMDEDGYPIIDAVARQACYWYCLIKIRRDDYDNGKVNQNVWVDWNNNYDNYFNEARGSFRGTTRDHLDGLTRIMYNMVNLPTLPNNLEE